MRIAAQSGVVVEDALLQVDHAGDGEVPADACESSEGILGILQRILCCLHCEHRLIVCKLCLIQRQLIGYTAVIHLQSGFILRPCILCQRRGVICLDLVRGYCPVGCYD